MIDVRKARLRAHVDRPIFVELPPEIARPGWRTRLKRCLCGARDAPKRWEAYVAEVMTALGFSRGRASPCCYLRPARGLRCVVHGDDFVLAGLLEELIWAKQAMGESFLTKEVGTLGCGASEVSELRVLNRVARWSSDGLRYEADPRRADVLRRGVGGAARALSTPGTSGCDANPDEDEELPEAAAALRRSLAARANYLALDRPDLAFPAAATSWWCTLMRTSPDAGQRVAAPLARARCGTAG